MKISTKGRYALRLMLDLALNSNGTAVPLKEARERQGISDKYLEQIVTQLSRAGLVRSVRGARRRLSAHPGSLGVLCGRNSACAGGKSGPCKLCRGHRLL